MRRGLVLGKFLPPHTGHLHLCEVALRMCDELTIVVASLAREPIAGALRVAWMRELVPAANVVHHTAELPQYPAEHPRFWDLWRESLLAIAPRPDRVFASEAYGERLASELGARWIPVDPGRTVVPVSGTAVRADPYAHAAYLPPCVRAHYARRVSVFGPESTGKTTLANELGRTLGARVVPEYARVYLESRGARELAPADLELIADGQAALEDTLAREAERVLVCDTDPLLTAVWAETLLGAAPPALLHAARERRYATTLLCDVDLPWVADPVRYLPDDRSGFFARCEAALRAAGRRFHVIRGRERLSAALAAIRGEA